MRTLAAATLVAAPATFAAAQVGSSADLWDFSRGAAVIAHSPFDDTHGGYDPRDAFGGDFHGYAPDRGSIIFADVQPSGAVHFIEWRTPAPVDLERFTMACSADHHAEDLRATAAFRLYGREEAGAPWILLYEGVRTARGILDHPLWVLDHEFEAAVRGLTEFRPSSCRRRRTSSMAGRACWNSMGSGGTPGRQAWVRAVRWGAWRP